MDPRAEGIYCNWEPVPGVLDLHIRQLVIEKVWGDQSVTVTRYTDDEAAVIREFLR